MSRLFAVIEIVAVLTAPFPINRLSSNVAEANKTAPFNAFPEWLLTG